jgi:hypothetical protein
VTSGERGSTTLWMIGLVLVVFLMGGIGLDLWRGLAAHRRVAAVVDAAAVAAGSGIDEAAWRSGGVLRLSDQAVRERVAAVVAAQSPAGIVVDVAVAGNGSSATVSGVTTVELTLLRLVSSEPLRVEAAASAEPVLSP